MRRPDPALKEILFQEGHRFDFFQAVRLLERIGAEDGRAPVGQDAFPRQEVVRFVAHQSLMFPASAIHAIKPGKSRDDGPDPPIMVTPFMGLIGPLGVLPTPYTEELIGRNERRRTEAIDFLNMFHHRLVSLFYRAWEKYNVPALWEQGPDVGGQPTGQDRFSRRLFDFIGIGLEPLQNKQHIPDPALLFYAGIFAQQHRSAAMLEKLVSHYFGHPSKVETFTGQWLRLRPDQQSRLGNSGGYNALGVDSIAGSKVWDDQSKFRVRIGPLTFDEFLAFMPGDPDGIDASKPLMDLIRFFVKGELDFDVQLILLAHQVPRCTLSRDRSTAARLGRHAWLKSKPFPRDAEDAVFKCPGPGLQP